MTERGRRGFLEATAVAGGVLIAGCSSGDTSEQPDTTETPRNTPTATAEPTPTATPDGKILAEKAGNTLEQAGILEEPPEPIQNDVVGPDDIDITGTIPEIYTDLHQKVNEDLVNPRGNCGHAAVDSATARGGNRLSH